MKQLKDRKAIRLLLGFIDRLRQDHIGAYAAQAAYFLMMSFIPFILFLTTIVQYTPLTYRVVRDAIITVVPSNLQVFVLGIVAEVYGRNAAIMPIAVLTTLWSAGKGLQSLINGLNVIYHVKETRGWLLNRLYSIVWTVLFVVALIGSLLILVLGNRIQEIVSRYIPFIGRVLQRVMDQRTFFVFLVLFLIFVLLYKVLPNRKASFRSQIPGALFTTAAWSLFSYFFSIYFDLFPNFMNMYGSLATIILVMLWLDICMILVLYGAELNAYFEKEFRQAKVSMQEFLRQEKETRDHHHVGDGK
jgi:membrane protein